MLAVLLLTVPMPVALLLLAGARTQRHRGARALLRTGHPARREHAADRRHATTQDQGRGRR